MLISIVSEGQCLETNPNCKRTVYWNFGDSCGLSFFETIPTFNDSFKGWAYEGTAIISDTDGNLLFYSDGLKLYNAKHQIVANGLKGGWSSSQQIAFHITGNLLHIFTTAPALGVGLDGFNYSIFNINTSSFLLKNKKLIYKIGQKQTLVNHQNNRSVWNVSHSQENDTFYFHIVALGKKICCPKIQKIGKIYDDLYPSQGILKFNGEGNLCLNCNWDLESFDIMNFDKENGNFKDIISIPLFYPYAAEFSSNSDYFYIVDRGKTIFRYKINNFQYDSILQSKEIVYQQIKEQFAQMQIANNSKIYVANNKDTFLSIINNPNEKDYDFIYKGISLFPRTSEGGLPNFNASYFYTPSIDFAYTEDCWEHKYSFEGRDTLKANSWKWFFRKNNFIDSILTKHCDYQFLDTGLWQVSHIAANSSRTDTVTKTLTIHSKWQKDILGNDTFYCQGIEPKFVLKAPPNMHCIHWNGEDPNLDEDRGPIIDYNHFHMDSLVIDTAGIYYVKITNKTFCENWDTIKIEEKPKPIKPNISFNTGELASTLVAKEYYWYLNDTFLFKTTQRSFKPNKNGYYQLKIVSEFGCESELSDSLKIDLSNIETITNDKYFFKIYPNPNQGNFNINVVNPGVYQIEITDLNGKLILAEKAFIQKNKSVSIELSKGSYIVNLIDSNLNKQSKQLLVD